MQQQMPKQFFPQKQKMKAAFERNLAGIPQSTQDRSLNAKFKIETFYKQCSQQVQERMKR